MIFVAIFLTAYVVLDGYDLGIGMLTGLERNVERRRHMHALVSWLWDGNESWLVMLALAGWAGVPLVFGVALPALYVPLVVMLFALIARGVSVELLDQHEEWHPLWGPVFALASFVAAFCQGAAFGGLIAGLPVRGGKFSGGTFTFLHSGYAVLTGFAAVALYTLAGSAYLYLKSAGEMQLRAARTGRGAIVALALATALSWLLAPVAGPVELHPGAAARLPVWILGAVALAGGLWFTFRALSYHRRDEHAQWTPVVGVLTVYAGGLLSVGGLLYPTLVPPHVTVHSAASPDATLLFVIVAAALIVPIILAYQAYGYWVFRGKVNPVNNTDKEMSPA
jgi:cytochrome d ubiquinol oxidase subunit II